MLDVLENYFCPLYKNRLITLIFSVTQRISVTTEHWIKVVFLMAVYQATTPILYSGIFYINKKTPKLQ